jgi:Protein of unknown function (DUF3592)
MDRSILRNLLAALVLAASLQTAWADTIDAPAKPYLVGGGWLLGLIFAALGGFFVHMGIRYRRTAEAMSRWPLVDGEIIACAIKTRVDNQSEGPSITRYIPHVRYAYEVGGTMRVGETIRIGLSDFGYAIEQQAREHVGRYPVGATVPVRHDPADPGMAVLEPGQVGGGNKIFAGSIFLLVGLCMIVVAIWMGGLEAR